MLLKSFESLTYVDPAEYLVEVQDLLIAKSESQVQDDKELREKVSSAFLACGLSLLWGEPSCIKIVDSYDDGGGPYDWVLKCELNEETEFVPVQVKSHPRQFWRQSPSSCEENLRFLVKQISGLSSGYPNSEEIIFTVHSNRAASLDVRELVQLCKGFEFRGLFLTGRGNVDGSKYFILGDLLSDMPEVQCCYFSLSSDGRIIPREVRVCPSI